MDAFKTIWTNSTGEIDLGLDTFSRENFNRWFAVQIKISLFKKKIISRYIKRSRDNVKISCLRDVTNVGAWFLFTISLLSQYWPRYGMTDLCNSI